MARRNRAKKDKKTTRYCILIVTTGIKTEKTYLENIKQQYYRRYNDMEIQIKTSTDSAEAMVSTYVTNSIYNEYDEFWFVVDKDNDDLNRFVSLCKKHKANGVISSPCFEVWLVAHYKQVGNFQSPNDAQREYVRLSGLDSKEKKAIPKEFPWDQLNEACAQSRLKNTPEPAINTIPNPPASTMPHLLRRLGLVD